MSLTLLFAGSGGGAAAPGPAVGDGLLLSAAANDGFFLTLETGDFLLLSA